MHLSLQRYVNSNITLVIPPAFSVYRRSAFETAYGSLSFVVSSPNESACSRLYLAILLRYLDISSSVGNIDDTSPNISNCSKKGNKLSVAIFNLPEISAIETSLFLWTESITPITIAEYDSKKKDFPSIRLYIKATFALSLYLPQVHSGR